MKYMIRIEKEMTKRYKKLLYSKRVSRFHKI